MEKGIAIAGTIAVDYHKIAVAAAACSLSEIDSTSGMKNITEIRKLHEKYKVINELSS